MTNLSVSIQGTLQNNEHLLAVNLTDNEPSQSAKSFGLLVSDYDGFPDPNRPVAFPIDTSQQCGWNLQGSNLGNFSFTFYAVLIIPPENPFPQQIEWTLTYTNGESISQWSDVTQ